MNDTLEAVTVAGARAFWAMQDMLTVARQVKAWRDSDGNEAFPADVRATLDAAIERADTVLSGANKIEALKSIFVAQEFSNAMNDLCKTWEKRHDSPYARNCEYGKGKQKAYEQVLYEIDAEVSRLEEKYESAIEARVDDSDELPICAQHDVRCEAHIVCPQCISENPELDACARELEESNREIAKLRSHLRSFEE